MIEAVMTSHENTEILSTIEADIGWITLNRPNALNSLSLGMIRQMTQLLTEWATDFRIKAVVVQGADGKAFCAGGDVRAAYEAKQQGRMDLVETFFREEYTLNTLVHEYPKPYIAILDGISMGGGLGISVNSPHAVVTERSVLAMPETGIGFFPDVGATWFLSNTPDSVGIYWAMTGHRFSGADAVYGNLASCYVPSRQIEDLLNELKSTDNILDTLNVFHAPAGETPVQKLEAEIHRHFDQPTVQAILRSLEESPTDFTRETLKTLRSKSPLSIHVAFAQLKRIPSKTSFRARMKREFRMSQHFMEGHDFFEGVRAVLIDKDQNPQWQPATLEDVTEDQVNRYFEDLGDRELVL